MPSVATYIRLAMEPLTEHVRFSNLSSGFHAGEHKIILFADNVILMLTNPQSSLAAIHSLLHRFSEFTYYKMHPNSIY